MLVSEIWDWMNKNAGGLSVVVALVLVIIPPVFGRVISLLRGPSIEDQLANPVRRQELIDLYGGETRDAYYDALKRVLGFANRVYGPEPLSWRAYGTCLTMAFAYPLIAVLIGWWFFNIHSPAGIEMFRDIDSGISRTWRFVLLVGGMGISILIVMNAEKFSNNLVARFRKLVDTGTTEPSFLSKVGSVVIQNGAFAVAFAGAGAGAVAFAGAVAGAGAVAFAGAVAVAFAGAVAGAVAVAVAVAFAVAGDMEQAALIFLLYALLPTLNAAADMLSFWITRSFLGQIVTHRKSVWWIIGQMFVDLALALMCLALLLGSLVGGLELWGWISPASLPFDWRSYWAGVHAQPQTGVAVYIMALTTLVPTLVHLIAGLGAVWTQKSRGMCEVALELEAQPEGQPFQDYEIRDLKLRMERAIAWGYAGAALVIGCVFAPLIWGAYLLIV